MDFEETMVENEEVDSGAENTPEEELTEEPDESESLESVLEEGETEEAEEKPAERGSSEPGWIKQRIQKAVDRALAEQEARLNAMFEEQMAPIREKMIEDEAQELVRTRKVADIETARELVRFRKGQPQQQAAEPEPQPRKSNGQFAPKEDPATAARIDMLKYQAARIKESSGIDVIAEWNSNPEVQNAVIAGEMDFYDVAQQIANKRKKPPSPMRSPNGASGSEKSTIASMSDEQFDRLEKKIKGGARYQI